MPTEVLGTKGPVIIRYQMTMHIVHKIMFNPHKHELKYLTQYIIENCIQFELYFLERILLVLRLDNHDMDKLKVKTNKKLSYPGSAITLLSSVLT